MVVVDVGFVKNHDFSSENACAHFAGPFGVILPGGVDDGAVGQEGLEIEPQVTFGGRLATAMSGPVQTRGDPFDSGGIHRMDRAAKSTQGAGAFASTRKRRAEALQMLQHAPKQLFRHLGVADLVGVRKVVAAGRCGAANGRKRPPMQIQRVTHVVEADAMRNLCEHHGHGVAPRGEGSPLVVDPHAPAPNAEPSGVESNCKAGSKRLSSTSLDDGWFSFSCLPGGRTAAGIQHFFKILWDDCVFSS